MYALTYTSFISAIHLQLSSMQLDDLNSKPYGGKGLRDIIEGAIGVCFCPPPESEHYTLLRLDRFHVSTHYQTPSNDKHRKMTRRESRFCIMCFVLIVQANFILRSFQRLCTPDLTTHKSCTFIKLIYTAVYNSINAYH